MISVDWSQIIPWLLAIPVGIVALGVVGLVTDRGTPGEPWPVHDPHDRDTVEVLIEDDQ